ncbi:MAG: HAMP domain-containing histidine kinase [Lachnospiraceae bacterium]|nr:HAMP domain-containing histidine kinase [Lachnospiraceae bacterium]
MGSDTEISDAAADSMEKTENSYNVSIYVISDIYSMFGKMMVRYTYPLEMDSGDFGSVGIFKNDRYDRISRSLIGYFIVSGANERQPDDEQTGEDEQQADGSKQPTSAPMPVDNTQQLLMTREGMYDVYKLYDKSIDSYFIDLIGFLDNGNLVFIRSSYENIQESVAISGKFLALVGVCTIIVGAVFMFIVSSSFTGPILELARISERMAGLDFESHYEDVKRKDEIGQLGNSINLMSDKLERTITDLKTANIELEKDIAQKVEIDELRKEFLSNVSHELKTPISLIQGYAEGLKDNINNDAESRDFYCDVIIDEAHKMNNMVKKLLSLNEIEFGNNKLDLERFDIVALVRGVASSIDILASQKQVSVVFNEHEPVYVWADQGMIEEVVTNYISNAINHVAGQRIIDIRFTLHESKARVSVFNTGEQIPEDMLDNIWVKFFKIDKARTREYGGSGIGLSIVKAIMEQHREAYGVINHPHGVEFYFELDTSKNLE